jgi:tRNA (guanosine-2'-O-)-methyltransferase
MNAIDTDNEIKMHLADLNKEDEGGKTNIRLKSDEVSKTRTTTFLMVLEQPANPENIASILRCAEGHNIAKIYVISEAKGIADYISQHQLGRRKSAVDDTKLGRAMARVAKSAHKWVYMRHFPTTSSCLTHLAKNNWTSLVTSSHLPEKEDLNFRLDTADFTKYRKLAVWMGNETRGVSSEALAAAHGTLQIPMWGRVESFNVACASAMIMYEIVKQRRAYRQNRNNAS